MILIPLLLFHLVQALGTAKGFINLISKSNNCVFFNFVKCLRSIEVRQSNMAALNQCIFGKIWLSAGPKILAFGSHCSADFQPILDCFIPHFKLKYEDSEI